MPDLIRDLILLAAAVTIAVAGWRFLIDAQEGKGL